MSKSTYTSSLAIAAFVTLFIPLLIYRPRPAAAIPHRAVTFAKDVAPILQAKCQECHQPGSIAPMSLLTYGDAVDNAEQIKEKVADRLMPPWHIDKTVGIQKFKNDRSLTDDQIQTIVNWVDDGTPLGNAADMPPAR
jgi:mono/diheme cytochrome c family protein